MSAPPKRIVVYLAALVAPALALFLRLALERRYGKLPPYLFGYPFVFLVAMWGGIRPGLLATAGSALMVDYWVLPPRGQIGIERTSDVIGLVVFCLMGVGISVFSEFYHRRTSRLSTYEKEQAVQEALRESEKRFRALMMASSDVLYWMSADWSEMRLLRSQTFLAETKTPERDWVSKYIHPDDQSHVLKVINEAIQAKSIFDLEHRVLRADGSLGWTYSRAIPLLDENGEIVEWFGAASDITERKRMEQVWRHLTAIVESSYDAIIGKTTDGTITSWNPGAERLYGYSAAEMVGKPISLLLPPGTPDDIPNILQKVANRQHVEDYETVRRRKDGSLVEVSLSVSPVVDALGNVSEASVIAQDITARRLAREALLRSEKLAATGRIAAAVAHEVNNPIAGAMNAVYIASTNPANPTLTSEMLKLAEQELRRAAHMTQQTLGFYRENSIEQLSLPKLIEEVVDVYATKLRNRSITIQRRYQCDIASRKGGCPVGCEGCEGCFLVNAGELRQILSNLLANGIDALSDGGVMQIRVLRIPRKVQLVMADNGCGIRAEHLKRVFEPFFTTKEAYGTGLGLWVTQELVRKHNGVIRVRSRKDKGTVFRLTFPQQAASDGRVDGASPTPLAKSA